MDESKQFELDMLTFIFMDTEHLSHEDAVIKARQELKEIEQIKKEMAE